MKPCDNKSQCHDLRTISDEPNAMRVICTICHKRYIIHKDLNKGNPEKRLYAKIFKRDILQGNDNLLYKYKPEFIRK